MKELTNKEKEIIKKIGSQVKNCQLVINTTTIIMSYVSLLIITILVWILTLTKAI